MSKDTLNAGFTGTPAEPPTGARKAARTAALAVKRETSAVAAAAANHPHTATGLTLAIGALAFALGYVAGRSSAGSERGYWH